jgi:mRNA-degrading endonuclease YafQ of YafQ-DinJ toxin-antitoxin module
MEPALYQVAGYNGDITGADPKWQEIPPRFWQHYVTVIGDIVYDPTASQFGDDKPTEYSTGALQQMWDKIYHIKGKEYHLEEHYAFEAFFDFNSQPLFEGKDEWTVRQSSNFKKGYKKHIRDKRVAEGLTEILSALKEGTHPMQLPAKYNVHPLKSKGPWGGYYDAHLKGQKILLIFAWDKDDKRIDLAHLGTHEEANL